MNLPPERAYAENRRAAASGSGSSIQDAPATSEIGRLDAPYEDAVVLPSWSIGAAVLTAHDALDTLAFLIGAQNAPAHPRAHAALIREVLTGALTPLGCPCTSDGGRPRRCLFAFSSPWTRSASGPPCAQGLIRRARRWITSGRWPTTRPRGSMPPSNSIVTGSQEVGVQTPPCSSTKASTCSRR